MTPPGAAPLPARPHLPCLGVGFAIMVAGTLYPPLMADAAGRADHALATALFWAMSAGFVRGVGFIPRHTAWRWMFSGWAVLAALGLALALATRH